MYLNADWLFILFKIYRTLKFIGIFYQFWKIIGHCILNIVPSTSFFLCESLSRHHMQFFSYFPILYLSVHIGGKFWLIFHFTNSYLSNLLLNPSSEF